jgi:transcriptional regulator with XRE-family HTH domain
MNRKVLDAELGAARLATGRAPAAPRELPEIRIGAYLKHARLTKGLRLKALAQDVGCTESFLSKVENNKVRPSLAVLQRIVLVLGINMAALFDADAREIDSVSVTRAGERPATAHIGAGTGVAFERLVAGSPLIAANIRHVEPGGASAGLVRNDGEEMGYVIEGEMELTVADKTYALAQGDSFFFKSSLPHGYRNRGASSLRVLWINTPATLQT